MISSELSRDDVKQPGVCYAKAWPPQLINGEIDVFTNDNCSITKQPLKYIDIYTKAIFFTLEGTSDSPCLTVTCWTQFDIKTIHMSKC